MKLKVLRKKWRKELKTIIDKKKNQSYFLSKFELLRDILIAFIL